MKLIDTGKKIHGVKDKHSSSRLCMCGLSDCICRVTVSFCGCVNRWDFETKFYNSLTDILFYDGLADTITCKNCMRSMRKYIIRKLKNEVV